jgi:hypothetical protein
MEAGVVVEHQEKQIEAQIHIGPVDQCGHESGHYWVGQVVGG